MVRVNEGSEAFVELLNANGVKYLFYNPGSDNFPVLEAISRFKSLGKQTPEPILCLHESLAMTAAHGYFLVTEQPQVVLIHADVGTQQVGGALHNAQRGMAGIILCAGCSPWSIDDRFFGSQFYQEEMDQSGIVRPFVKWSYELRCNDNINQVVQRAFQIANTEPHGPVYLILPSELLMEKIKEVHPLPIDRYGPALSPEADTAAIMQAAKLLVEAQNPLITSDHLGRHPQAVAPFVELAEILGARVVTQDTRMNFPTNHPLWCGSSTGQYLKDADVILVIDQQVPYLPGIIRPSPGAKIIFIDIDPIMSSYPLWNFPADIRIQSDSSKAVPALRKAVLDLVTDSDKKRFKERFQHIQEENKKQREGWQKKARGKAEQRPISPEWLAYCIGQEIDDDTIVIDETISSWEVMAQHLRRTIPGTVFRGGGYSLGWGLGCALGAKLAAPGRTLVCLTTDGAFILGEPVATLLAAKKYNVPFLTIVLNNGGYYTVKRAIMKKYGSESIMAKTGEWEGVEFTSPDFGMLAQSCGIQGESVNDPVRLSLAIREALEKVRGGQSVVLEVCLEMP